ncbi:MAG: hypothetical protein HY887_05895 [Deltaproteobacteria bacterium]|nr:hypothetical protein [Deltaproteobacteria bacterium]
MNKSLIYLIFFLLLTHTGCSNAVRFTLSDDYGIQGPYTVAVLPVRAHIALGPRENGIKTFFRDYAAQRLKAMGFSPVAFNEGDAKYAGASPKDAAAMLNADAALYIRLTSWKESSFVTYAGLEMSAVFELYGKDGSILWQASYSTKESDIALEKAPLDLALIKAYEPRIERFVDAMLSTLPMPQRPGAKDGYFQWLP